MNILFWNLKRRDLSDVVKEIAIEHKIDVFVFCEHTVTNAAFLKRINTSDKIFQKVEDYGSEKLKLFSSINSKSFTLLTNEERWLIYKIKHFYYPEFLLIIAHLTSKISFSEHEQFIELNLIKESIINAVKTSGVRNIILLGDLNINPFEKAMIATKGLHTTMDKNIALKIGRTVQKEFYNFLYNPMWNFLGDESLGKTPGTYFYRKSGHISYDWHMFDQVLYSHSLIPFINVQDIDIVFKTKSFNLVNKNGRIDKKYSDHLPLKFTLKHLEI